MTALAATYPSTVISVNHHSDAVAHSHPPTQQALARLRPRRPSSPMTTSSDPAGRHHHERGGADKTHTKTPVRSDVTDHNGADVHAEARTRPATGPPM